MRAAGSEPTELSPSPHVIRNAVEISIRLGSIALLVGWCLMIIAPFLGIVVWALIITIALDDGYEKVCVWLGGRRILAAALYVGLALFLIFGPTVLLSETLVSAAQEYAQKLKAGELVVPPPSPAVRDFPVVGSMVYDAWLRASQNLGETLSRLAPQLRPVSGWLLKTASSVGVGILELIGSILIAGVMLVRSKLREEAIHQFAIRMAGPVRGPELANLARATVRSVVQGILGVAALQAILAGTGFVVAGIPGAGLWALLVLVAAIVQLPVILVMSIPIVIGFSTLSGAAAIGLMVWCMAVGLVDNVLKPILFGRGVRVPMLVIFMGALGGMLTMGIIGLFLGSVVLAVGFELFKAWLEDPAGDGSTQGPTSTAAVVSAAGVNPRTPR